MQCQGRFEKGPWSDLEEDMARLGPEEEDMARLPSGGWGHLVTMALGSDWHSAVCTVHSVYSVYRVCIA